MTVASGRDIPLSFEERSARVKAISREIGFDACGVTGTDAGEGFVRYLRAVEAGYAADMTWLAEAPERRADVRNVWPEARSVVALAVSYADPSVPGSLAQPPAEDEGWIARYAQGRDYHLVVKKMLIAFAERLASEPGLGGLPSTAHRLFVDTGPVLEKHFAQLAGLGWIGKNSLLIRKRGGSFCFLAVVLTPLELAHDTPHPDHCGSCRRCLDACPTDAFAAPYVLDARKCISTWTIESPHPAAVIEPHGLGQHIFGCDICQDVCPWNRRAEVTRHESLRPRPENVRPKLSELHGLAEPVFRARFSRSAVRRVSAAQLTETIDAITRRGAEPDPDGG
jgi:epoxyqueuosine reductase